MVALLARLGRAQDVGAFSLGLGAPALGLLCPQAAGVIWWLGVTKTLEGLSDVFYGLMQRHGPLDWVSRSTQARGLLGLALLGGLFALTGSVACDAAGLALAGALTLVACDLLHARRLDRRPWLTRHVPAALSRLAALFGRGLSALAWWAGTPPMRAPYGPEYAAQAGTLVWLTLGGALGYLASGLGFAVTATRQFRAQVPLFVLTTLTLAFWVLVPRAGLIGAAQATLAASSLQLLGSGLIMAQALRRSLAHHEETHV